MWRLKSCPKCGGDVEIDRDEWGWYEQCIQCGCLRDLQNVIGVKPERAQKGRIVRVSKGGFPLAHGAAGKVSKT